MMRLGVSLPMAPLNIVCPGFCGQETAGVVGRRWALQPAGCWFDSRYRQNSQPGGLTTRESDQECLQGPHPTPLPWSTRPRTAELNQAPAQPLNCEPLTQRRLETQPTRCNGVDARTGSYGWVAVLGPQGVECRLGRGKQDDEGR